jgi:hypothetical protein
MKSDEIFKKHFELFESFEVNILKILSFKNYQMNIIYLKKFEFLQKSFLINLEEIFNNIIFIMMRTEKHLLIILFQTIKKTETGKLKLWEVL